nr:thioredoxin domain-containing protein [Bacteroidota bacterium]
HAHNLVNWYPWGDEAWEKARAEDKLVIISIGYSACHWCHVMERESFEDAPVAKLMNAHYVCIKVDREERPDVDAFYMDAVNLMTGRGGWPLNAFALPDGRPVYAGTYFPKNQWMGLLHELTGGYRKGKEKYHEYAQKLTDNIAGLSLVEAPGGDAAHSDERELITAIYNALSSQFDHEHGGRGTAPKFPMPVNYKFLLRYYYLTKDENALGHTRLTLDKMASGGIYDQLGGGFSRYSVDAAWKVPHFEKMLYDNAQLISLYSEAWQITGSELYKNTVYQTIDWLEREMLSPEGGFYCALDADSEGVEGKFYVWTAEEINKLLTPEEAALITDHYGIDGEALWEDDINVLLVNRDAEALAKESGRQVSEINVILAGAKKKMMEARRRRVRPGLDDKILLSWNALAVMGLLSAYKAFAEERFLKLAENTLAFLQKNMVKGTSLYRTYKNGEAAIPAFLEDYAFYIYALTDCYQVLFRNELLEEAETLTAHVIAHYEDKKSGFFYFTSDQNTDLVSRKIDSTDNVLPSPNSVMAENLFVLGHLLAKDAYLDRSAEMMNMVKGNVVQFASFYSNWSALLLAMTGSFYEVAIVGEEYRKIAAKLHGYFLPNKVLLASTHGDSGSELLRLKGEPGKTLIYVCADKTCAQPVEKAVEAMRMVAG